MIGKEHSIVLMNHKYDIDWLMGWILSERLAMLGVSDYYNIDYVDHIYFSHYIVWMDTNIIMIFLGNKNLWQIKSAFCSIDWVDMGVHREHFSAQSVGE